MKTPKKKQKEEPTKHQMKKTNKKKENKPITRHGMFTKLVLAAVEHLAARNAQLLAAGAAVQQLLHTDGKENMFIKLDRKHIESLIEYKGTAASAALVQYVIHTETADNIRFSPLISKSIEKILKKEKILPDDEPLKVTLERLCSCYIQLCLDYCHLSSKMDSSEDDDDSDEPRAYKSQSK